MGMLAAAGFESALGADLLAVLATAAVVALVMQRLRLAVVPAYLIAGIVVGPHALRLVRSDENLAAISHLAIILLLFGIGLQLHLSALRHGLVRMLAVGLTACLLCVLVGWAIAMGFGLTPPAALAVSMALALSSTAVVLRILSERREVVRTSGRLSLSILVVQDLVVIAMLASLPSLAKWMHVGAFAGPSAESLNWASLLLAEVARIAAVALMVIFGSWLLPRLIGETVRGRSVEMLMVVSVAVALAAAIAAKRLGFSLELGAFLAGFLLARTPFRHQIAGQVAPLRDLFIAVFFTAVGMNVDPLVLANYWPVVLAATVTLLVAKAVLIGGTCWIFGVTSATAAYVGLSLAQAGEFSLVLLGAARGQDIVDDQTMALCVSAVVLSLIVTPGLISVGSRLQTAMAGVLGVAPWVRGPAFKDAPRPDSDLAERPPLVIVAGFGPMGRRVAEELERVGLRCTVIELNRNTVMERARGGKGIVFGDAANPAVLESAGIDEAAALVLSFPDEELAAKACATARRASAGLFIAARAHTLARRAQLLEAGADLVVVDEAASADQMVDRLCERFAATDARRVESAEGTPT